MTKPSEPTKPTNPVPTILLKPWDRHPSHPLYRPKGEVTAELYAMGRLREARERATDHSDDGADLHAAARDFLKVMNKRMTEQRRRDLEG